MFSAEEITQISCPFLLLSQLSKSLNSYTYSITLTTFLFENFPNTPHPISHSPCIHIFRLKQKIALRIFWQELFNLSMLGLLLARFECVLLCNWESREESECLSAWVTVGGYEWCILAWKWNTCKDMRRGNQMHFCRTWKTFKMKIQFALPTSHTDSYKC